MDKAFTSYRIEERSFVSYIKREIHSHVVREKFTETQVGEIDIIVAELSSNLIKHVGSGELLYRVGHDAKDSIFEIVCIDKGAGMSDTLKMIKDGVSTTRTLGHGLGSMNRLSDTFQLYSIPGWGTILYAMRRTVNEKSRSRREPEIDVTALCINKPKETVCGDGYRVKQTDLETSIFFGDGLGHGEHAKEATDRAADIFFECNESNPVEIIRAIHENVRRTRGLVATIAVCDRKTNEWKICGVGNILTRMYSGIQYKNYMPYNGTIGLNLPNTMKPSVLGVERNQHLIMCSDGIQTRWDLSKYPSIFKYNNAILAAALYKDFSRGNDDASVLVAKVI
jgi:anti-sigma regulatory factor (Ser/Thr protein kinase)